tara:strand:+ start:609 stop:962 length:354 start_codon:yes stop_codon:yes gene_type:complete
MYLGDFGKIIFLTKNQEDAKTKKQKKIASKKIKEFTTEYGNRFKKDGNLKKEFENKYLPAGLFGAETPKKTKKKKPGPKVGVLTGRRAKRTVRGDITKKMNMGGVMKARGGTFKGTY